jgi:hypothetical protein
MEEINCWDKDLPQRDASRFSHFTFFTRTKVHTLAPEELRACARTDALDADAAALLYCSFTAALLLLYCCFTFFTSTKVPILKPPKYCVPGPMR